MGWRLAEAESAFPPAPETHVELVLLGGSLARQPSALLALRSIGTAGALWVVVGVPVSAAIAALSFSVWVIASFPAMALTAALLGAVQGLWFCLAGQRSKPEYDDLLPLGLLSGGFLGLLGFPPVFSRASIIAARPTVAVFLMAAIVGGLAAGLVAARVLTMPLRGRRFKLGWKVVIGGLIVLTAIDYRFYWPAAAERIAAPEVSRQEIANLSAGDARGSAWAGCYKYQGRLPLGTGGETGQLKVAQTEGMLRVEKWGEPYSLLGGVDRNGRFRFGAEISTGQGTLRVLWQGKFHGNYLEFKRRTTVVNGANDLGARQLTGTAQLTTCYH